MISVRKLFPRRGATPSIAETPQRPVFGGPQLPSTHEPVKDASRRARAVAPSSPSLTASPLRACSYYARKGKERPFRPI